MSWVEDILVGAISNGVNKSTLAAINICLGVSVVSVSCTILLIAIPSELKLHLLFLALLSLGLLGSINWLVGQTGTVSVQDQRRELFGDSPTAQPIETQSPKKDQ